jgi:hypothetical protein
VLALTVLTAIIEVLRDNKLFMENKCYRHGETALRKIDKLPVDLELSKSKVFMKGSHGHDHSIDKGNLYFKNDGVYVFGYLEAKNTKLFHPEHSPKGDKIEDGVYELRKQQEYTPSGLVPIID